MQPCHKIYMQDLFKALTTRHPAAITKDVEKHNLLDVMMYMPYQLLTYSGLSCNNTLILFTADGV